ncbi:hypothetical protein M9H77_34279 [Catharanthus roseus]|uniref:Uncharacterized protein n=1 Tax=Catharanthus roseus TaxID=4058 RepID=A0ACB9ZKS8_CATRO|nr:hypothetical protein M9H77_34279 [Catharanthus roseus]
MSTNDCQKGYKSINSSHTRRRRLSPTPETVATVPAASPSHLTLNLSPHSSSSLAHLFSESPPFLLLLPLTSLSVSHLTLLLHLLISSLKLKPYLSPLPTVCTTCPIAAFCFLSNSVLPSSSRAQQCSSSIFHVLLVADLRQFNQRSWSFGLSPVLPCISFGLPFYFWRSFSIPSKTLSRKSGTHCGKKVENFLALTKQISYDASLI